MKYLLPLLSLAIVLTGCTKEEPVQVVSELNIIPIEAFPAKRYALSALPVYKEKDLKSIFTRLEKSEGLDILEAIPENAAGPRPVKVKLADGVEGYVDGLQLGIEPVRFIKTAKLYRRPDAGSKIVGLVIKDTSGYLVDGIIKDNWKCVVVASGNSRIKGWVDSSVVETASMKIKKEEEQSGKVRSDF